MSDDIRKESNYKIENIPDSSYSYLWQSILGVLITIYFLSRKTRQKEASNDLHFLYNKDCPICFDIMKFPIRANCNHGYCLECLNAYSKKTTWNNKCPLCRYPIKKLQLVENGKYQYMESTRKSLLQKINRIYTKSEFKCPILTSVLYCLFKGTLILTWILNFMYSFNILNLSSLLFNSSSSRIEIKENPTYITFCGIKMI